MHRLKTLIKPVDIDLDTSLARAIASAIFTKSLTLMICFTSLALDAAPSFCLASRAISVLCP